MDNLPKPKESESLPDWMLRCMADPEMVDAFPEEHARKASCHTIWNISIADDLEFSASTEVITHWQKEGGMPNK